MFTSSHQRCIAWAALTLVACNAELDVAEDDSTEVALRDADQVGIPAPPPLDENGQAVGFPACGDGHAAPPVRIEWAGSADGLRVPVEIVSQHLGNLKVGLEVEILAGGEYFKVEVGGPVKVLEAAGRSLNTLDLAALLANVDVDAFTVSGQVLVHAVVEHADGRRERIASEPRYFHPLASGGYAVYDAQTMDMKHGNGNFRGAHGLPPDPDRMGFVDGGQGLPPAVVAQILAQEPDPFDPEEG